MVTGGTAYDAIVIGGGHNGLVAAARLARDHGRVLVLEARDRLGGAAATSEIVPDYRAPAVAHLIEGFPRKIEKQLKLAKYGLRYAARDVPAVALDREGDHILLPRNRKEYATFKKRLPKDAEAYRDRVALLRAQAELIAPLLGEAPPPLGDPAALKKFLRTIVLRAEWQGHAALRKLMHTAPESIGDRLDAEFESPLLKGVLAFDATLGGGEGPYAPGTSFRAVWREAIRMQGQGARQPAGGTGALADALAAAVEARQGEIRLGARAVRIVVEGDAVAGVELFDGTVLHAPLVVSALNPRVTMLGLLGAARLETEAASELRFAAPLGCTAKINLALETIPVFSGLEPGLHGARLIVSPSLHELDEAFAECRDGGFASEPVMEILVPSLADPSLAPEGHHILSIVVHNIPFDVEGGWETKREVLVQKVVRTVDAYAPGIANAMIAGEILTPGDIERKYGLAGGDWHQGDLRLDRLFGFRPSPSFGRYETPVPGLYLCGAGSHPGGGITGLPGWLAAGAIEARKEGGR